MMRIAAGLRRRLPFLFLLACVAALMEIPAARAAETAPACPQDAVFVATSPIPSQRVDRYARHLQLMKNISQPVDIILLGDSLLEAWDASTPPLNKYRVKNLGIGADKTQNVLWRLDQLDPNGLDPKLVIVMIGTNNIASSGGPACGTAAGVEAVLAKTRALWPEARVVFVGIPPRGKRFSDFDADRLAVNSEVEAWIKANQGYQYVNIDKLITCNLYENISLKENILAFLYEPAEWCPNYKPDFLHLSPAGYAALSEVLLPN